MVICFWKAQTRPDQTRPDQTEFFLPNNFFTKFFLEPVSVGFPSPANDYLESPIDLNQYLIKNGAATFLIRVSGDSMIHANIGDQAILIVDRSILDFHDVCLDVCFRYILAIFQTYFWC